LSFYVILVKSSCFYKLETYAVDLSYFLVLNALVTNIKLSFALRLLKCIYINGIRDNYCNDT